MFEENTQFGQNMSSIKYILSQIFFCHFDWITLRSGLSVKKGSVLTAKHPVVFLTLVCVRAELELNVHSCAFVELESVSSHATVI